MFNVGFSNDIFHSCQTRPDFAAGVNEISISTILGTIDLDLDGNIILLDIDIFYF